MMDAMRDAIDRAARDLARQREDILRKVARERLPRPLRWTADHPRVLRVVYRLRGRWRPTLVFGFDGGHGVATVVGDDGTLHVVETFSVAAPSSRREPSDE